MCKKIVYSNLQTRYLQNKTRQQTKTEAFNEVSFDQPLSKGEDIYEKTSV